MLNFDRDRDYLDTKLQGIRLYFIPGKGLR
ncbi:hypothetical protein QE443_003200 [Pantoea ananatis]|jgi:hypothetical protein|nr:hypothetical protein L585_20360 [Pantoea ananatis BRT175]MDQ1227039.1 hypothetical protein [Pantoea ananatis]PWW10525.1 hypothetical protein DFO57_11242 [Pantoea sp. AG702]MDR6092337.1 hypothetical protein [Pantoea ananatis]PVY82048.1 hypothetical protein C7427_11346 [Pantoea ananatis]